MSPRNLYLFCTSAVELKVVSMTALSTEASLALRSMAQHPHRLARTPRPVIIEIARAWLAHRRMIGPNPSKGPRSEDGAPNGPKAKDRRTEEKSDSKSSTHSEFSNLTENVDVLELIAQTLTIMDMERLAATNRILKESLQPLISRRIEALRTFFTQLFNDKDDSVGKVVVDSQLRDPREFKFIRATEGLVFLEYFYTTATTDALKMVDYETVRYNTQAHMQREDGKSSELGDAIQMGFLREPIFYSRESLLKGPPLFYLVTLFIFKKDYRKALRIRIHPTSEGFRSSDIFTFNTKKKIRTLHSDGEEKMTNIFVFYSSVVIHFEFKMRELRNGRKILEFKSNGLRENVYPRENRFPYNAEMSFMFDPKTSDSKFELTVTLRTGKQIEIRNVPKDRYEDLMPTFKYWRENI